MVFSHEFETRICFMNSRHEWALLWSALNGHNVLARVLLRVSNLRGLIKPVLESGNQVYFLGP